MAAGIPARRADRRAGRAGEWHVVEDAAGLVGTVRLLWSDPDFWGADQTPAVYVHGLMVDRRRTGDGLGAALLDWAAQQGRDAGVDVFRLDCRTTNPVLRDYYEAYGFTVVGQRDFDDFSCTLLELSLRLTAHGSGPRSQASSAVPSSESEAAHRFHTLLWHHREMADTLLPAAGWYADGSTVGCAAGSTQPGSDAHGPDDAPLGGAVARQPFPSDVTFGGTAPAPRAG